MVALRSTKAIRDSLLEHMQCTTCAGGSADGGGGDGGGGDGGGGDGGGGDGVGDDDDCKTSTIGTSWLVGSLAVSPLSSNTTSTLASGPNALVTVAWK